MRQEQERASTQASKKEKNLTHTKKRKIDIAGRNIFNQIHTHADEPKGEFCERETLNAPHERGKKQRSAPPPRIVRYIKNHTRKRKTTGKRTDRVDTNQQQKIRRSRIKRQQQQTSQDKERERREKGSEIKQPRNNQPNKKRRTKERYPYLQQEQEPEGESDSIF